MIKNYTFTFLILFFLINQPINYSQKATHQKSYSPTKEKLEYYYDFEEEKAEIKRKYYYEFSSDRKSIEVFEENDFTLDYSKKKFINYTSYSRNYFKIDDNESSLWNGKHWNFRDYPLKVHIKKTNSKNFKDKYLTYIDYAFEVWTAADERINFAYTNSSSEADIIFTFEDNLMEKYNENYLGLTDYEVNKNKRIIRSFIEISLLKFDNRKISDGELKSTIIHELGHALGLGHSSNHGDLMYPYLSEESSEELTFIELSTGDIEAIRSVVNLGVKEFSTR